MVKVARVSGLKQLQSEPNRSRADRNGRTCSNTDVVR